jgi:hypothetical protein
MPRRLVHLLALFSLLLLASTPLRAADPLDREVDSVYAIRSFANVITEIEGKTGFTVQCPKDVADYMARLNIYGGLGEVSKNGVVQRISIREFLNMLCYQISMTWAFDPATGTISLDHPWHTTDPRSARELLAAIRSNITSSPKGDWRKDLAALLSKPSQPDLAWKTLQCAVAPGVAVGLDNVNLGLACDVIAADGKMYFLVLLVRPLYSVPAASSASYYAFREDGTLALAGVFCTGMNCFFRSALATDGREPAKPSEIQMSFDRGGFITACFRLENDGLKLASLVDAHGEAINPKDSDLGDSLLPK